MSIESNDWPDDSIRMKVAEALILIGNGVKLRDSKILFYTTEIEHDIQCI